MNEVSVKDFRLLSEKLDSVNRKIDIIAERQTRIEKMLLATRIENENMAVHNMLSSICLLDKVYDIGEEDIVESAILNLKANVILYDEKSRNLSEKFRLDVRRDDDTAEENQDKKDVM